MLIVLSFYWVSKRVVIWNKYNDTFTTNYNIVMQPDRIELRKGTAHLYFTCPI